MTTRRGASAATLAAVILGLGAGALGGGGCAGLMLPPVEMGSATASAACQQTISRVFADSGFEPVSMANAPPMLFAPRMTAPLTFVPTMGWAVGVSFTGACDFHLQALSSEPDCMVGACFPSGPLPDGPLDAEPMSRGPLDRSCYGLFPTCPLSPTGGSDYSAALAELTRRIGDALSGQGAGAGRPR